MSVDMREFELALLEVEADLDSADEVEAWLHDPSRTAHRLVSVPTAELMEQAVADTAAAPLTGPVLPEGVWRVLPDRLLALHPGRRAERLERLRIPVAAHLTLTADLLERWGWARTQSRRTAIRSVGGRRCILGAQHALYRLGYGTEVTADDAGRQIQGALAARGITIPYPAWNELPTTTARDAVAVVRAAAKGA